MNALRPLFRTRARAAQLPCLRTYATGGSSTTPPMLVKIRADLKTAMRSKDTARLSVLRSILSSTLNASKTNSPIQTDLQLLHLIKKSISSSQTAISEFQAENRADLVEKETEQVKIMEEYIKSSGVEEVGEEEINGVVRDVIEGLKKEGRSLTKGEVMKGVLVRVQGKEVDKRSLMGGVEEALKKQGEGKK